MAVTAPNPRFAQLPLFQPEQRWTPSSELPSLGGVRRLSLDVETRDPYLGDRGPGTHRGDAYIVGLAVGADDGRRWYLPVRHAEGGNLDPDLVWRWARAELNEFDGEVVGANLIYDLEHLWFEGVTLPKVKRFRDVLLAEPLLDEQKLKYDLDSTAETHLGEGKREELLREAAMAWGFGKDSKTIKQNLWRLPGWQVGPYGEGDADLPLRILEKQEKLLADQGLTDLFDLECRLIPVLLRMRLRGVRVDLARAEEVTGQLKKERSELLSHLKRLAGPKADWALADVLGAAIEARGIDVPKTPKSGQYSVKAELLEKHAGDELIDTIARGRKLNTIIETFLNGAIFGSHVKGRVYAQFPQLKDEEGGTIARFASRNPNLQNIPKRDKILGPLVRSIFVPEEGERWWRGDYSQIEYRFLAHYAVGQGAEAARRQYSDDPTTDFHKFVAEMLGVDPEDKVRRGRVKNTNFAKGYGAQAPRLAVTFGCSVEEAEEFVAEYDHKLPFAKETFELAERVASRRGYVKTILGRYGRFDRWVPDTRDAKRLAPLPREKAEEVYATKRLKRAGTYMALNRVLQGSAADLMKKAMVDGYEAGIFDAIGAYLLTVHDELDNSAPDTKIGNEAAAELQRIMETCMKINVPIRVESDFGAHWGECT